MSYVAPVFMVKPKHQRTRLGYFIIDCNIFLNKILPRWLLRRLDARPGSKAYWAGIRKQEQRAKKK